MNILIASSEVVPFAKTGGLADVCGALPIELARQGHEVQVFVPAYRAAFESGQRIESTGVEFDIPVGSKIVRGELLRSQLPGSDVPVYLVHQSEYFDRSGLYSDDHGDYKDNCERFVFFCRAIMEAIRLLPLHPNILHCNDWQTGLLPAYLELEYKHAPGYESIGTILTVHNLAYQGSFWHWDMVLTGLDWKYFNWQQMEFFDRLNLLKTGLVFTDLITTVSPSYAKEIQTSEHGCGLESVLRHRSDQLHGIINGVDYDVWNPKNDDTIAANYSVKNWKKGKATCKRELQKEMGLAESNDVPLFGLVGRLAEQKGWDLVIEVMESMLPRSDAQWAILGTGDQRYADRLEQLASEYPNKVAAQLGFSNERAHQIEAGADLFLMPSRFEPCGLNQLYSLKYGTLPVVHSTGGLVDTIVDANSETLADHTATGFRFTDFSSGAFLDAIRRALDVFIHQREAWNQMVETAMNQDWSWAKSAKRYVELYQATIERACPTV